MLEFAGKAFVAMYSPPEGLSAPETTPAVPSHTELLTNTRNETNAAKAVKPLFILSTP